MRKGNEDPASKITIHAMVDLDNQHVYALKVGKNSLGPGPLLCVYTCARAIYGHTREDLIEAIGKNCFTHFTLSPLNSRGNSFMCCDTHSGCHNNGHVQCHGVLPPAEGGVHRLYHFNRP